jgi:hypothetical protein
MARSEHAEEAAEVRDAAFPEPGCLLSIGERILETERRAAPESPRVAGWRRDEGGSMDNRERVFASLGLQKPDRIPYDIQFTQRAHAKMAEFIGPRVRRLLEVVGQDGGDIAAPSHEIPADAKPENVAAMIEVLQGQ